MAQSYEQDGKWAWIVCVSATLSWLAALGFVFSFGIFFPVFMDYFHESREKTGKARFKRRSFHEPNLISSIKYMKRSASESN